MTSNRARRRTRSRCMVALIASLLVVAIASISAASAATRRTVTHPNDGLHETNWLPAPPGSYSLMLRAYVPGAAIRQGTWSPPTIRPQIP